MDFQNMTIAQIKAYLQDRGVLSLEEKELLKEDRRRGTIELLNRYNRKQELWELEQQRLRRMLSEEEMLGMQGYEKVAGVDEAGRGPLAGPVIAAAVILKPGTLIKDLKDSKKLSARSRENIFEQIIFNALSYGIGAASRQEIDRFNIHAASMLAMRRALARLSLLPDYVLVDGFPIRDCPFEQKAIKGGDNLSMSIAAASVLAKVSRDRIMLDLHHKYPRYGFDRNRGYGTADHKVCISRYGPCPAHRRSFRWD